MVPRVLSRVLCRVLSRVLSSVLWVWFECVGAWKPAWFFKGLFCPYTKLHLPGTSTTLYAQRVPIVCPRCAPLLMVCSGLRWSCCSDLEQGLVQSENFFDQKLALATPTRQRVFSTSGGVGSVGDPWEVCNFCFFRYLPKEKNANMVWYSLEAEEEGCHVFFIFSYSSSITFSYRPNYFNRFC